MRAKTFAAVAVSAALVLAAAAYDGVFNPVDFVSGLTTFVSGSDDPSATDSQRAAVKKAKTLLQTTNFSYSGLIKRLVKEKGCSTEDATYAADNCGADWNDQALGRAKSYLKMSWYSRSGLIEQLESEGFDEDQATYGVDNSGADWMELAEKEAAEVMGIYSYSRAGLIEWLLNRGFTFEQAEHGADSQGL